MVRLGLLGAAPDIGVRTEIAMSDAESSVVTETVTPKTITLTDKDIQDAARLFRIISEGTVSSNTSNDGPDGLWASPADRGPRRRLLSRARALLRWRRLRTHYFDHVMFSEPAWDILLMLYVSDVSHGPQKLSHLVEGVETPSTTALRWIDYLENQQLVERTRHPIDQRLVLVGLTSKTQDLMDAFLNEIF